MANLTGLPLEILEFIAASLGGPTLKSFSLVNRRCRAASERDMFSTAKITFSESDFTMLEELSRSYLVVYVNMLYYNASELFDPGMSHTCGFSILC